MSHYPAHLQPDFLVSQNALAAFPVGEGTLGAKKGKAELASGRRQGRQRVTLELNPERYTALQIGRLWARRTGLFWNLQVLTGKQASEIGHMMKELSRDTEEFGFLYNY